MGFPARAQDSRHSPGVCPPTLPTLVQKERARQHDNIELRGQRGDWRDLRPSSFLVTCPKCKGLKDVAGCELYGTAAKVLLCTACRCSSTSSKLHCSHGISWLQCPIHRPIGFRCKGTRISKHKGTKASFLHKARLNKANLKRLERIGSLGVHAFAGGHNSASCLRKNSPKKHETKQRNKFHRGPEKGESRQLLAQLFRFLSGTQG